MAASPEWKVYSKDGEYLAAVKYPEDAAVLMSAHGDGATVRHGHRKIVWTEGREIIPAQESYDIFAAILFERIEP